MTAAHPRRDEATPAILSLLRVIDMIAQHEPSAAELLDTLDMSRATLKRRLALARAIGVQIRAVRRDGVWHYRVIEPGPFDLRGLRQAAQIG